MLAPELRLHLEPVMMMGDTIEGLSLTSRELIITGPWQFFLLGLDGSAMVRDGILVLGMGQNLLGVSLF